MSRGFTKRDLKGALQALIDIDPREAGKEGERKCHFCETPEVIGGERSTHDSGCSWTIALLMLTDDPNLAMGIFVGEDIEEAETRLAGEEGEDDWAREDREAASEEEIVEEAAAFSRSLDVSQAKRQVMAELRRQPLDGDPIDVDVEGILDRMPVGEVWDPSKKSEEG